jgi:hypothetical protein
LEITRPYQDLYSFDSRKVKCLGMIKDLVVNLAQIPIKSILMDVVVADVPKNMGCFFSRSWGVKLGGSLQLDMTYATIPLFGGNYTRLYRETKLAYTQSVIQKSQQLSYVYVVDQDLGSCILSVNSELEIVQKIKQIDHCENLVDIEEGMWKMYFDGALHGKDLELVSYLYLLQVIKLSLFILDYSLRQILQTMFVNMKLWF